jgi:hypothetical protein
MKLAAGTIIATVCIAATLAPMLGAQEPPRELRIDLALVDAPYNVAHGLRAPSMAQSLAVSEGFYEAAHAGIQRAFGPHRTMSVVAIALFDTFGGLLPGGDAWVHEEFHRAVMGNRGIGSFDDVYRLNLAASTIAVSHVRDEDLIRLKASHPAEQVRLGAAGIEAENLLVGRLEQNRFFGESRANNVPFYWLTKLNSLFYVASGATEEADSLTDEMNAADGADVPVRDFTGHDFTAWVYDLHRPTEAYEARGVHPSGVGIDRYIKASDLTPEERRFLEREGRLQLINFLDPNLIGISGVTVRSPWNGQALRLSAGASHYLTSFGHAIDVNLLMGQDAMRLAVALHRYTNGARSFPGVEAELRDVPMALAGLPLDVSPRVALWLQPDGQGFRTSSARPGVLASLRIRPPTPSRIGTFLELEAKTEGWVAGNVNLWSGVSARLGGSIRLN